MSLSREALEARRLEAANLFKAGFTGGAVARRYNVSRTTTSRWLRAYEKGGADGLKLQPTPGRPRRYDWRAHKDEIQALWREAGYPTYSAFSALLSERLNATYSVSYLGRILHEIGVVTNVSE